MRYVQLEDRAGLLIASALLLGGSTSWGSWTGVVLTLLALWLLSGCLEPTNDCPPGVQAVLMSITLLLAIQFLPIPGSWLAIPAVPGLIRSMITLDVGRTVDSGVSLLPALAVFLGLPALRGAPALPAMKFLIVGVVANLILALLQFLQAGPSFDIGLPYSVGAGTFANANHFASLMAASLPMIVRSILRRGHPWLAAGWAVAATIGAFASASAVGVALTALSAAASLTMFLPVPRRLRLAGLALVALATVAGAWQLGHIYLAATGLDRPLFARTTMAALLAYWPFGSGMGTFDIVYPQFERVADIFEPYVNHAHNDFLEFGLEGGAPGIIILMLYLGVLLVAALRGWRDKARAAGLLAIASLLIHSAVDYPLRTTCLQVLFAYANALVFLPSRPAGSIRDGLRPPARAADRSG